MAVNGDACSMTTRLLLEQVFELADDWDHSHPTDNSGLFRKLLRKYFSDDAGRLDSSSMIQEVCSQLWERLASMECRPPDGWVSIVVTSLFLLTAKHRGEELVGQVWRIVAHPAEEKHGNGLGRRIMREAVDGGVEQSGARSLALMTFVVDTLRRGGHPPGPSWSQSRSTSMCDGGEENEVRASTPCGLRLALDVASHTLETFLRQDVRTSGDVPEISPAVFEAWRRDVHLEVVRLIRFCRLENMSKMVLSIARPLYQHWGNVQALKDVWSLIASSGGENVELYLGLLCVLTEDLRPVLDVPTMFVLIYSGVSSESALCRRRGLHVLQQVLVWADEESTDGAGDVDVGGEGQEKELAAASDSSRPQRQPSGRMLSREALLEWKDYVRCLHVLCEETELHLVDQVVPTVERLCSKLSPAPLPPSLPPSSASTHPPMATEFKWVAIPLGMLIQTGTFARRRRFLFRLVKRELGLGKRLDCEVEGGEDANGEHTAALSRIEETWVARVLLPALDHVGWHSSTARGIVRDFSESVTDFLRCYVAALSAPRVTVFLALLLEAIRERMVGSIGGLCAILAAFDLGGTRVSAMGRDVLYQLKETLLVVLPPLNQAKRVLFLDGVARILVDFTDYGELIVSLSQPSSCPSLCLVTSILSAFPLELVRDRYLPLLATWVAGVSLRAGDAASPVAVLRRSSPGGEDEQHGLWVLFTRRLEAFLGRRRTAHWEGGRSGGGDQAFRGIAEGRSLALLGLVLSEGFTRREDRDQVLASGLSPLIRILRQCWHEPYVSVETVQAALILFGAWAAVSNVSGKDGEEGGVRRWRWRPLEVTVFDVVTLVTARLESLMEDVATMNSPRSYARDDASCGDGDNDRVDDTNAGRDAQVLLLALDAAAGAASGPCGSLLQQPTPPRVAAAASWGGSSSFLSHPGVVSLGDRCISFLTSCEGGACLPPTTHMLTIASLEIIVRARGHQRGRLPAEWDQTRCKEVVISLLQNKVQGRVPSKQGSTEKGSNSEWGNVLKQHELQKWSCLSTLLPVVLGESGTAGQAVSLSDVYAAFGDRAPCQLVCKALMEGIQTSSREEMPQAMTCFRTAFPVYVQTLPEEERAAAFKGVFEVIWDVFKEVRRPQLSLVRDLVAAVLHPSLLAMPELTRLTPAAATTAAEEDCGAPPSRLQQEEEPRSSCMVEVFSTILEFGTNNNKATVLRAVVGMLTVHGRQSPGSLVNLVPGLVDLLLFKEWGHGIENFSNGEGSSASTAAEAPRFMLLLFFEDSLIPVATKGNQDSRLVLSALTFRLMKLLSSKEARQSSITDPVAFGRKLRSWQALCVLCGYFCDTALSSEDSDVLEVVNAISSWFWPVHGRTALPPVRQHMEVFAVRMCIAYPDLFLSGVTKELKDFRLPGQVLCSLLIITGHTLLGDKSSLSAHHRVQMFQSCLPWMVGTHVMGRLIAQLVCFSVLPECASPCAEGVGDATTSIHGDPNLETLFLFLRDNPEMIKMRQRQAEAFGQTDCEALCTVEGMLEAHGTGSAGDITPTHMCELLKETMDEIWNEALRDRIQILEDGRAWLQTAAAVKSGAWFEKEDEAGSEKEEREVDDGVERSLKGGGGVDNHIQQKIIPWDTLDLTVESASSASLEQSTATGRVRQPVVMCASLVDKVPNIAGLARTSEIFAATKLVIRDKRILKNPAFSKISTGAEQWLPIEEVAEDQLVAWLRRVKRRAGGGGGGHVLVGVEQTNNSVCLTKMKFHKHLCYTLVIGRENSGLPLEVINEMDVCCQIPQQGVLRSLNAHVSGAIILAEYSRQMLVDS